VIHWGLREGDESQVQVLLHGVALQTMLKACKVEAMELPQPLLNVKAKETT
jgi:hypothetical protein